MRQTLCGPGQELGSLLLYGLQSFNHLWGKELVRSLGILAERYKMLRRETFLLFLFVALDESESLSTDITREVANFIEDNGFRSVTVLGFGNTRSTESALFRFLARSMI